MICFFLYSAVAIGVGLVTLVVGVVGTTSR